MRKVQLIETEHTVQGNVETLNYRNSYLELLTRNPEGLSYDQMRKIDKVYDKLEKASAPGFIFLEDAEHEVLAVKLLNPQFTIFTKELLAMCASGIDAPVSPEQTK